jgi:hypothetical protein
MARPHGRAECRARAQVPDEKLGGRLDAGHGGPGAHKGGHEISEIPTVGYLIGGGHMAGVQGNHSKSCRRAGRRLTVHCGWRDGGGDVEEMG